jgi:hypothetical protein
VEQQAWVCRTCARALSPDDTIVFAYGVLGHLDCRRPRALSAEERTLLFIYCRDHDVADCVRCARRFHLREVASLDSLGIHAYECPWCNTDLTDSMRAHLDACAMLPLAVRRRAQAAREAARSLVKQSHQLRDGADVRLRDAEAALHALRDTMRQASTLSAASEAKHKEEKTSLLFDHVLPMHLHVGDRLYDEIGEWEVVSEPYSIGGGNSVNASVRRVDQPATVEDRTWVAYEQIRVRAPQHEPRTSAARGVSK